VAASWSRSDPFKLKGEWYRVKWPGIIIALSLTAIALSGCGSTDAAANRIHGTTLTIYSSVPLHGASRYDAQAVVNGERLALIQARGHVGQYRIVLKTLDDSTPQRDGWDPGQTTVNARLAIQDPTTIGYLGELNSGASAVSIPLLNRLGIPQVSPTSTAVGLTSGAAGAAPGEPQKYYPTGIRTFARVVPNDRFQAAVQVRLQQRLGCRKTYVVDDGEVDGEDLADSFALVARAAGLRVVGIQAFEPHATSYAPLALSIAQSGAGCVLISSLTESGAPLLTRQIGAAMPAAQIFGSAPLAESTFTVPALGGIPLALDPRLLLTLPVPGPDARSAAAAGFYAAYERRYGPPQPDAIFGYEAMSLMLNALARASDGGRNSVLRTKVLDALFDTRDRHSVLGTYSIASSGDTTIRRYGIYRVIDGGLRYWMAMDG
jgi:branched-chain amino acid transport system substrate-binding protein